MQDSSDGLLTRRTQARAPSHGTLATLLVGAALLLAVAGFVSVGLTNARAEPIMRSLAVAMPNWAAGAPPIRVALLSDIHVGNLAMDLGRLERIVADVNAAKPDLVLIAGDFTVGHAPGDVSERASALAARLAGLDAPLGVVAVLGNHDYWVSPDAIRSALVNAGVVVLENQAVPRGALTIVGVGDRFSGHDDIAQASNSASLLGGAPVVLTHSPDVVPDLPRTFTVVLAGHTHCGQVDLPWWGPVNERSPYEHGRRLYDPHYLCGVIRDPGRLTIVTAGVGSGTVPLRIGAMPDWWLLTFGSKDR